MNNNTGHFEGLIEKLKDKVNNIGSDTKGSTNNALDLIDEINQEYLNLKVFNQQLIDENNKASDEIEKYSLYLENNPMGNLLLETNGKILYLNKAAENIFGKSRSAIVGQEFSKFIHPSYINYYHQHLNKGLNNLDDNHATVLLSNRKSVIFSSKLTYHSQVIIVSVDEITSADKYELEMMKSIEITVLRNNISRAFYAPDYNEVLSKVIFILLEKFNCNVGYFNIIDEEGSLVVTPVANNNFSEKKLLREQIRKPEEWNGNWGDSLKQKKSIFKNTSLSLLDKKVEVEKAIFAPILSDERLIGQIIIADREESFTIEEVELLDWTCNYIAPILIARINENATENKRKEVLSKLDNIISHSNQLFYVHDQNNNVSYVSPQCYDFFGYTQEETMKNWNKLIIDNPANNKGLKTKQKAIHTKKKQPNYFLELQNKAGKNIWVEIDETPVFHENKGVIMVGSMTDITEKRKAEQALKQNKIEHERILDSFVDAVYVTSPDYKIAYMNKAMRNTVGSHAIGEPCYKIVHNRDTVCDWCVYKDLKKKKEITYEKHFPQQNKDFLIKNILRNNGSKLSIFIDITFQKNIENELRKLSVAVEQSPISIVITDTNGNIEYVNTQFTRLTGYNFEEVYGKNPRILQSGKTSPKVHKDLWDTIKNLKVWKGELVNKKKNGEEFYEESVLSPIRNKYGEIINYVALKSDITQRKKIEIELRKLSVAVDQSPLSIVITDTDGIINYVNPNFTKLTGYTREEAIGQNPKILNSGKNEPSVFVNMWETLNNGNTWHGEIINKKKNGDEFIEQSVISPIIDDEGNTVSYIALKEDITSRKIIEKEASDMALFALLNPEPVFRFDDNGNILQSNPSANNVFNLETLENALIHEIIPSLHHYDIKEIIESGKLISVVEKINNEVYKFLINGVSDNSIGQVYGTNITDLKRAEAQILEKSEELEFINKSLVSSISYAKIIQNAVLPSEEFLKQFLPESFVLYLPRDIVSGDFYWIKQIQNKIFMAAADCTGHGVPGAFMSMLGITLLNGIVTSAKDADLYKANLILNQLRKELKLSLHQDRRRDTTSDGMDLSFCIIDIDRMKMQFAGANNPLYLIRKINNKYELVQYSADRMPIGVHIKETSFTNNYIKLEADDLVFMFSDGFVDQFGPEQQKYKSRRFRNFLVEIAEKPLADQKELLNEEFHKWKGDNKQVDDVLIMGLRISESYGDIDLF